MKGAQGHLASPSPIQASQPRNRHLIGMLRNIARHTRKRKRRYLHTLMGKNLRLPYINEEVMNDLVFTDRTRHFTTLNYIKGIKSSEK